MIEKFYSLADKTLGQFPAPGQDHDFFRGFVLGMIFAATWTLSILYLAAVLAQ